MRVRTKEEEPIKTLPLSEVKEGTVIRINDSRAGSLFLVTNGIIEYKDWDDKWEKGRRLVILQNGTFAAFPMDQPVNIVDGYFQEV